MHWTDQVKSTGIMLKGHFSACRLNTPGSGSCNCYDLFLEADSAYYTRVSGIRPAWQNDAWMAAGK